RGEVFMTELLGRDTLVDVRSGDQSIRALVPGDVPLEIGENVWLELQPQYVHLFDAGTEARLPDLDLAGSGAAAVAERSGGGCALSVSTAALPPTVSDANDADYVLARRHLPILMLDRMEPFRPVAVGYHVFYESGP